MDSKKKYNVLFIGHPGAGKSTTIEKILNQDEVEEVKGITSDFGDKVFKFKTTEFHILEFPSHYRYIPKLMSRALRADIAVLLVSSSDIGSSDIDSSVMMQQTKINVDFIRTFKISTVLLVLRKLDDSSSCDAIVSKISAYMQQSIPEIEIDKVAVKELSSCSNTDSGINELLGSLVAIEAPPQQSQSRDPRGDALTSIHSLVLADRDLDDIRGKEEGWCWYNRAGALLRLGVLSERVLASNQPWVRDFYSETFAAIDQARSLRLHEQDVFKSFRDTNPLKMKLVGDELRATKQYEEAEKKYGELKKILETGAKGAVEMLEGIVKETKQARVLASLLDKINTDIDASPSDGSLWFMKAKVLLSNEMVEEGFDASKKALECNYLEHPSSKKEKHPLLHKLKGDHYREQKKYNSAVEEYTKACDLFQLESCKKIIQAARNECIALAEKEMQLKDIDKSLCEDAKNAILWYKKANVLIDLEIFDEAFNAAERASENDYHSHALYKEEDSPLFHKMQGDHYFAKNNFDAALDNYQKARDMFQSTTKIEAVNLCQDLVDKALIALYPPAKDDSDDVEIKQKQKNESSDESQKEIEEVNEQEKEEKEDISKEIEEVNEQEKEDISQESSGPCEIKVACSSEFLLEISQSVSQSEFLIFGVHSGFKRMSNGVMFPKSLIECTIHHKQDLKTLMFLGLGSSFILRVEDMSDLTIRGEKKTYLCTECVVTLESHFTLKCEGWRGDQKYSDLSDEERSDIVGKWWNFVKFDFIEVFRDIVDGLIYLYSKGCACGDLLYSSFVVKSGRGKILPSMNSTTASHSQDLRALGILMKRIVYLPIPGAGIVEKYLPNEVQFAISVFEYFKNEKDHLPFSWIIDQPLFWTPLKRAYFMINLRRKMPNYSSFYDDLEESLFHGSKSYRDWFNMIPNDGIYRKIFSEGDSFNDESNIRVRPYEEMKDIVRYMNAVYCHHNDARYSSYRKKALELSEIDLELRQFFPNVHELAYFALCEHFMKISYDDPIAKIKKDEFDVNSKEWKLPPLVN